MIVEDNTGLADANSYTDAATFKTYHKDRGTVFDKSSTEIEQGLIIATDYIDRRFGGMFKGVKEFTTNDLEFPRTSLYNRAGILVTGIPNKLVFAVCEYAAKSFDGSLFLDPTVDDTGLRRIGLREKVGPIETETRYAESTTSQVLKPYPVADRLLTEYLFSSGSVTR